MSKRTRTLAVVLTVLNVFGVVWNLHGGGVPEFAVLNTVAAAILGYQLITID